MVNNLKIGFFKTIPGIFKILEFMLVLVVLHTSWIGIDGSHVTWRYRSDLEFIGISSDVGYAIIIPAIIITYLLGATPLLLEFIIDLIGGILFILMGALVVESGIPTIFVFLIIILPIIIPAIISNYVVGVEPSVLEFVINLVGGGLFIAMGSIIFEEEQLKNKLSNEINEFKGISRIVAVLATTLGIVFLMDFILLCATAKYSVSCRRESVRPSKTPLRQTTTHLHSPIRGLHIIR